MVSFTADAALMNIAFAFRDDPSYIEFTNASLVDLTTSSTVNLLMNGAFDQGSSNSGKGVPLPKDWVYTVLSGSSDAGVIQKCCGAAHCWVDGSIQGYDELSQAVQTTVGNTSTKCRSPPKWSAASPRGRGSAPMATRRTPAEMAQTFWFTLNAADPGTVDLDHDGARIRRARLSSATVAAAPSRRSKDAVSPGRGALA